MTNQKYYPYFGSDTSSVWDCAAFVFLRRHFEEKPVFASQNVDRFFRLFLGKERAATGDIVVATTKNHLAKTAAHEKFISRGISPIGNFLWL